MVSSSSEYHPAKSYPCFSVTGNVSSITSPANPFKSPTSFPPFSSNRICASIFVSSVFVGWSFTYAVFSIVDVIFSIVTLNDNVTIPSPFSVFAGTSTSIPCANSSAVFVVTSPFIAIVPSTKLVPVGISSITIAFPLTSSKFVIVIVYFKVLLSSNCPFSSNLISFTSTSFINVTNGVFTSVVSCSFTCAVFTITPSALSVTFTLNVIKDVSGLPSSLGFATLISIPFSKSFCVKTSPASLVASWPSILMLPSTKVVPSGIASFTMAIPSAVPLFVTLIVYSSSPPITATLSTNFSAVIIGRIIERFAVVVLASIVNGDHATS